eukprot:4519295-Pleurochrysis_carterae.AAC.1
MQSEGASRKPRMCMSVPGPEQNPLPVARGGEAALPLCVFACGGGGAAAHASEHVEQWRSPSQSAWDCSSRHTTSPAQCKSDDDLRRRAHRQRWTRGVRCAAEAKKGRG